MDIRSIIINLAKIVILLNIPIMLVPYTEFNRPYSLLSWANIHC